MIDDQLVLRIERLRDEAESLKVELRRRYRSGQRPVTAQDLREIAALIAERWLVEVAGNKEIANAIGDGEVAERSVHFQRLLTHSERSTLRKKYDQSLGAILKNFRSSIIVPLKAHRNTVAVEVSVMAQQTHVSIRSAATIFIGQSFSDSDREVNSVVQRFLAALGKNTLTGEKPRAATVSQKVRDRIDRADVFIGIFTKRDKIEGKPEWTTSTWVIDEKAYAFAKGKKLVMLREYGVASIGGLQGDYEYLEFDRENIGDLLIRLLETFMNTE